MEGTLQYFLSFIRMDEAQSCLKMIGVCLFILCLFMPFLLLCVCDSKIQRATFVYCDICALNPVFISRMK